MTPREQAYAALAFALKYLEHPEVEEASRNFVQPASVAARVVRGAMKRMEQAGYRRNPGLVIYSNPPRRLLHLAEREVEGPFTLGGVISKRVESIAYVHAKDGEPYKHDFEEETWLAAVLSREGKHNVVLFSPQGNPLWQDF